MSGSYRQCPQCGKRALSIATRCPGCGAEFPAREIRTGGGSREMGGFLTSGRVAAFIGVVAVIASAQFGRSSQPVEEQTASVGGEAAVMTAIPLDTGDVIVVRAERAGMLLVAKDWTHVRKSRSVKGELEAMLMPGDTVLADSLSKGWYRVALEGEVLGYAHHTTLAAPADTSRMKTRD